MRTKAVILLVEDFVDARDMYREYLEFSGFTVETAGDGYEAIAKAHEHNPDLVLMDLSLPGLDGWEATRRLRADPATAHLTIVALSAHALAADWERARLAGWDGFIVNPRPPQDLVNEMMGYLRAARAGGTSASARRSKKSS